MELQQTKMLLHSKGNLQQNEKTTHWMGECIGNDTSAKGLAPKIYKELTELKLKKKQKNTIQWKTEQRTQIDTFPQKTYKWPTDTWKDTQCHWSSEMQIKSTLRYHLPPVRMATINKSTNSKCWRGCGERGPSCSVGGNADWCIPRGNQYGGTSKY